MKIKKYYFTGIFGDDEDEWSAYQLPDILEEMKELELPEIIIYEANRVIGNDYFICNEYDELVYTDDNECGKHCIDYKPRNKKNGCCIHRDFVYERGDEYRLKQNGELKKVIYDNRRNAFKLKT